MGLSRTWGLAALVLTLIACGATVLVPIWATDLEQSQYYNYLYPGEDGDTTYLVSLSYRQGFAQVTALDGAGAISGEWELNSEQLDLYSGGVLVPLAGDRAVLVGRRPRELLLIDPVNGTLELGLKGLQLADNERLEFAGAYLTSQDTLVLNATLFRESDDSEQRIPASAIIDQQGNLLELQLYSELTERRLTYDADNQRFVTVVTTGSDDNLQTSIRILDEELQILSEQPLPFYFRPQNLIHGYLLGRATFEDESSELAVSLDGSTTLPASFDYGDYRIPTTGGYYELGTGYNKGNVVDLCFYSLQFEQRWCRQVGPVRYLKAPHLLENGNLGFSLERRTERVAGVTMSIDQIMDALLAGVDIQGEVRRTVTHYVYNPQGQQVAVVTEPEFSYQGRMTFCSILDFCISADHINPGVCSVSDTMYRGENELISAAGYCDDASGNWDRRVSLWRW